MGGKKKSEEQKQKRQRWSKIMIADVETIKKIDNILINPEVAINEKIPESTGDSRPISLVLVNYKKKECQLHGIDSKTTNSLTDKLKHLTSIAKKDLPSSGLVKDKINNSGPYKSLYDGLGQDIEMIEIKFSNEGRIFGHFVKDFFLLVAIKTKHISLD